MVGELAKERGLAPEEETALEVQGKQLAVSFGLVRVNGAAGAHGHPAHHLVGITE